MYEYLTHKQITLTQFLFVFAECKLKATTKYLVSVLLYFSTFRVTSTSDNVCKQSEYQCHNGRCISTNRFCNSVNDCGDNSDEPRFCTRE